MFTDNRLSGLIRPDPNRQPPTNGQNSQQGTSIDRDSYINRCKLSACLLLYERSYINCLCSLLDLVQSFNGRTTNQDVRWVSLFDVGTAKTQDAEAWPEYAMVTNTIYQTSYTYDDPRFRFQYQTDQAVTQILQTCNQLTPNQQYQQQQLQPIQPLQPIPFGNLPYWSQQCRSGITYTEANSICASQEQCLYDYTLMFQRNIARKTRSESDNMLRDRNEAAKPGI